MHAPVAGAVTGVSSADGSCGADADAAGAEATGEGTEEGIGAVEEVTGTCTAAKGGVRSSLRVLRRTTSDSEGNK